MPPWFASWGPPDGRIKGKHEVAQAVHNTETDRHLLIWLETNPWTEALDQLVGLEEKNKCVGLSSKYRKKDGGVDRHILDDVQQPPAMEPEELEQFTADVCEAIRATGCCFIQGQRRDGTRWILDLATTSHWSWLLGALVDAAGSIMA